MRLAASRAAGRASALPFWVYVEGPRDRDVVCAWARRWSPVMAKAVQPALVIMGGRQPARAAEHLEQARTQRPDARGVCILDRDGEEGPPRTGPADPAAVGLELFTWTRRHIESYLLVRVAIERVVRASPDDGRLARFFRQRLPDLCDEEAWRRLDAKTLFAPHGELTRLLGRSIPPGKIARAMRAEEFHEDVRRLLGRLADGLGVREAETARRA